MILERLARLPTTLKMLLSLLAALLPLGLIAFYVSLESARSNRLTREAQVRMMAMDSANRLDMANAQAIDGMIALASRLGAEAAADGQVSAQRLADPVVCRRSLDALAVSQPGGMLFGLFDPRGRPLCLSPRFSVIPVTPPPPGIGTEAEIVSQASVLRFTIVHDGLLMAAEIPAPVLSRISRPAARSGDYSLLLWQGDARLTLAQFAEGAASEAIKVASPVAGGQLALEMRTRAAPLRAIEILMVLLPMLMLIAAGLIGWLVVSRMVLRPLAHLQQAVRSFDAARGPFVFSTGASPPEEIRALADDFGAATARQARHEAELAEGLSRQTKLTREVHHRVKNNLQVVSSLINLHARGARSEEASEAYAAIQRRVDALAVVHRNHYAELEENRGVGMRALIGEIASNLRGTATGIAAAMPIRLDVMPASASQDVAVPVAFLITEIAEMAMHCAPRGGLTIRLRPAGVTNRALLELIAPDLSSEACEQDEAFGRFERVLEGLSRQLRAPMTRDAAAGSFAIEIAIAVDDGGL